MKHLVLLLIAVILLTPAMAKHHQHKKKHSKGSTVLAVGMSRSGCYGRCPIYDVLLSANGTITYTGKRFVTDTGIFIKKTDRAYILPIIDEVIINRVDTCKTRYRSPIPDLPGFMVTVVYADSTKRIIAAEGGPAFLKKIANEIDGIGNKTDSNAWIKK